MRTEFLCISVFRVASGPRVNFASCKSVFNTPPEPWWITLLTVLRRWSRCWSYPLLLCCLFYEAICFMSFLVLFCSCVFLVLWALRLPRLGKRELILVLFVRLFDLRLLVLSVSSSPWCLGRAEPKLPYFDDSKDINDSYLSGFEITANKWDPSLWAAYLSALLKGRALDVYDRLSDEDAASYDKLKEAC